jgi:hypothetical protein
MKPILWLLIAALPGIVLTLHAAPVLPAATACEHCEFLVFAILAFLAVKRHFSLSESRICLN